MKGGSRPFSGPAPLSAAERAVRGSKERPRHRRTVVTATPGRPVKPRGVFGSAGGREWARLVKLIESEHRLTASDGPALMVAAASFDNAMSLRNAGKGVVVGTAFSQGLVRAERQFWLLYQRALSDLCLTPATRSRAPEPAAPPKENAVDRFLRMKPKTRF
jgi:hypothetical protein